MKDANDLYLRLVVSSLLAVHLNFILNTTIFFTSSDPNRNKSDRIISLSPYFCKIFSWNKVFLCDHSGMSEWVNTWCCGHWEWFLWQTTPSVIRTNERWKESCTVCRFQFIIYFEDANFVYVEMFFLFLLLIQHLVSLFRSLFLLN